MLVTVLSGHWQTNFYPDWQTNLQNLVRFIRITRVRFLLKFVIFIRIIVNLRPNFENFIRIIEIALR